MSKKSKTSEMNDIIDSSYAEPDYSYDNEYYDNVDNRRYANAPRSSYDNPFSKVSTPTPRTTSTTRPPPFAFATPTSTPTSASTSTSNIFMKYTGGVKMNAENVDKTFATPKPTEIKNTEDEFPSLGGSKKSVAPVPAAMNFKKVVETKKPMEVVQPPLKTKPKSNPNHYMSYEELKYYSEKTARSRIHRGAYYDDDEDDDMDDDVDNNYYDDDE